MPRGGVARQPIRNCDRRKGSPNFNSAGWGNEVAGLPIICSDLHCLIPSEHEIHRRKFHLWNGLDRKCALA